MKKTFGKGALNARKRGAALVEFALVLPILLLLSMGIIQYGIIFNATNSVSQIAREGGRSAAVNGLKANGDALIEQSVRNAAASTGLVVDPTDLTIAISPPPSDPKRAAGEPITVSVTYNMRRKVFLPSMLPQGFSTYTRPSTFMLETPPGAN